MFRAVEGHDWPQTRALYGIELFLVDRGLRIERTWARIPWTVEEVARLSLPRSAESVRPV